MARILSIYIDPETCTCSQACVFECPEVLEETQDGVPRVREVAENILKHTLSRSNQRPTFVRSRR